VPLNHRDLTTKKESNNQLSRRKEGQLKFLFLSTKKRKEDRTGVWGKSNAEKRGCICLFQEKRPMGGGRVLSVGLWGLMGKEEEHPGLRHAGGLSGTPAVCPGPGLVLRPERKC